MNCRLLGNNSGLRVLEASLGTRLGSNAECGHIRRHPL
jgi:hypothetical protein